MKKKFIIVLLIVFAFLNVAGFAIVGTSSSTPSIDYGPEVIDVTPEMLGEKEIAMREYAAEVGSAIATGASPIGESAVIGVELDITVSDFVFGDYDETFVVLMEGVHGIILIEKDAYDNYNVSTDEYVFANPNNVWRDEDRISTAQLAYLLNQFDTVIYPIDTGIFGELLPRGDEGQKVWILIHNIRDEAYYIDYDYYVAGYFSSAENAMENKNMFHIDSYDWQNRVSPDGERPYLYEGTFAHEFEHMIHFDVDPDEPSWVDEGLADLAGYLCGYGHPDGHLMYYMAYHPMTSLTFWGGELEDYGMSYMFQLYLFEHFGGIPFVTALVNETANGIEGIENTLAAFGYTESFDEIFDIWTIANYLDDPSIGDGEYSYELLSIGSSDTRGWTIDYAVEYWNDPPNGADIGLKPKNSDWFYGIEPQPYTAHYFHIRNRMPATIVFNGDDFSGTLAHSGTYEWYSGANAWAWQNFGQTFTLPSNTISLDFYTFFDIEGDWDYGYVEIHDVVADEWYTLADSNGNTVSNLVYAQDNPNVPLGREPMDYFAAGRWNAFTGFSGGYIPISMDLTAFAGKQVEILFTLWQDGAFTLQNMYVDDISIILDDSTAWFSDDVELGMDGWTSTGWYITDGINDNSFSLTLLEKVDYWGLNGEILNMNLDPDTESGIMFLEPINVKEGFMRVAIVTNHADHILTSHYDYRLYGGYQWFRGFWF